MVRVGILWRGQTTTTPRNVTLPNHDTQTLCTEHMKRRDLAFNPKKLFIKGVDWVVKELRHADCNRTSH